MSGAQRRGVGVIIVLGVMLIWIVAAATVGAWITDWPWWAELGFYLFAGVAWIAPLRPVFAWMARGGP